MIDDNNCVKIDSNDPLLSVFVLDEDDDDDDDVITISVIRDNGQQISLANSGIVNMIIDKMATSL